MGDGQKWHLSKNEELARGDDYFLMPALRATLTSAEAKPCIYQQRIEPGLGESTFFKEVVTGLKRSYGHGHLFRIIDADAGLTSLCNASCIVEEGYHYVLGLKGNQAELFSEAKALLLPMAESQEPEVTTDWECREGKRIRRCLWRTADMAGIENSVGKWTHLVQTWLLRQETRIGGVLTGVEDRFFVTSMPWAFLKPHQIVLLIRSHWGVEVTFNSLDLQWREDASPWCTKGSAVWALGILRLMAYNTAQLLRRRRIREKKVDGTWRKPMCWRALFKIIEKSFEIDLEEGCHCTG